MPLPHFSFINSYILGELQLLNIDSPAYIYLYHIFSYLANIFITRKLSPFMLITLVVSIYCTPCDNESPYLLTCTAFPVLHSSSCLLRVLQNRNQLTRLDSVCQVTLFHLQLLQLLFCSLSFQVVHFTLALCAVL